jgi:hypothetical protein
MKKRRRIEMRILSLCIAILVGFAGLSSAVTFVGNYYNVGSWTGSLNTYTMTGASVDGKYWEYENITVGTYNNSVSNHARNAAWFTQKYVSVTPFSMLQQKFTDGYIQDDLAGSMAYIDISTDNATWTRVWSLVPTTWTTYFPTTWKTILFSPTTTLYVRYGVTFAYDVMWQAIPSWSADSAGVILYDGPQNCEQAKTIGYFQPGDVNKDCAVDFRDFAAMASRWLYCTVPGEAGCATPWLH